MWNNILYLIPLRVYGETGYYDNIAVIATLIHVLSMVKYPSGPALVPETSERLPRFYHESLYFYKGCVSAWHISCEVKYNIAIDITCNPFPIKNLIHTTVCGMYPPPPRQGVSYDS